MGIFLIFFIYACRVYFALHCIIDRPSDSTVSEDAGIEPSTMAFLALAVTCTL